MKQLGPLQLRIMRFIWSTNTVITVKKVHKALNAHEGHPELAYTTVGTVMRNLVKAGFLASAKATNTPEHSFVALVDREDYITAQLQQIQDEFFKDKHEMCKYIQAELENKA